MPVNFFFQYAVQYLYYSEHADFWAPSTDLEWLEMTLISEPLSFVYNDLGWFLSLSPLY